MGLMYWQINDIWQAPTWSTIDYALKWKMAHYYVRHMYAPIYPIVSLSPYLANTTDEQAKISIYIVNEYLDNSHGQLICSIHTVDTFSVRLSFAYEITFDSTILRHVVDLSYASLMERANCMNPSQCIIHCLYDDGHEPMTQTLLLSQPKFYQLIQPNLHVKKIEQQTSNELIITIDASRPALFVWLEISGNTSGYFSNNGFHMFSSSVQVKFHSWIVITNLDQIRYDLHVTSLFDVTQM
jgi:beta-mannosidase